MQVARGYPSATVLQNGKVLVAGGALSFTHPGIATPITEIFDPETNSWSFVGNLNEARFGHDAILLRDGRVLVFGGRSGWETNDDLTKTVLKSSELFDPTTNTWTRTGDLNVKRGDIADALSLGVLLPDGRVLAAGGYPGLTYFGIPGAPYVVGDSQDSAEIFDPGTGVWSMVAAMKKPRYSHGLIALRNGKVLAIGGCSAHWGTRPIVDVEMYDPLSDSWSDVASLPNSRCYFSNVLLGNGHVMIYGPEGTAVFDPTKNVWTNIAHAGYHGISTNLLSTGQVLVSGLAQEIYTPACSSRPGSSCDAALTITSLSGPPMLATTQGRYVPDTFTITATVRNNGPVTGNNVNATLYLPSSLVFANGSATQHIGDLAANTSRTISWHVRANGVSQDTTLTYFLQAGGANGVATSVSQTIMLRALFSLRKFSPSLGGNAGKVTVTIIGSGFQAGANAYLGGLPAENLTRLSDEEIQATFNLLGQTRGGRVLTVRNPDGFEVTAPQLFSIISGGEPKVRVDILGSSSIRVGTHQPLTRVPFHIAVHNTGLIDAENISFHLRASMSGKGSAQVRDRSQAAIFAAPSNLKLPFGEFVPLDLRNIPPGKYQILPGEAFGSTPGCVEIQAADPCKDEKDSVRKISERIKTVKDAISAINQGIDELLQEYDDLSCRTSTPSNRDRCEDIALEIDFLKNRLTILQGRLATLTDQLNLALDLLAECLRRYGLASSQTLNTSRLKSAVHATASNSLSDTPESYTSLISCPVGSADPNDKFGTSGVGAGHFIGGSQFVPYTIQFENKPAATAPAQEVIITDQLDTSTLDLSTFSFGLITFGTTQIEPPPGSQQFSADVDLYPANNLIVRIDARLNDQTGLVAWRFVSLDPLTRLPTTDPLAGFLPPNRAAPEGEGSVFFSVMPKLNLPNGTQIRNKATIFFDINEPIETPEWVNTIDIGAPISRVLPLPTQGPATFSVRWSGMDDGAGVRDYSIFVSESGGPFELWLSETADTSASFTGQVGKSYAFYSIARDFVGNTEAPPVTPDAITTVVLTQPVPGDVNGDGNVNCLDLAIVKASFGKRTGQVGFDYRADTNNDGVVNIRDLAYVSQKVPSTSRCN